jgi:hypothetical protein
VKLVALFRFRPGMTREEGIEYYETKHVPLICELMPGVFADYRRSFVLPNSMVFPEHMEGAPPSPPEFDLITELWFSSREHYDRMITVMADPAVGERVARDEANFLDRSSMIMFLVDERITAPEALGKAG